MALDWNTPELARGLECYRERAFFDTHEHWETVWLRLAEPEKTFLQALIQVSGAFHHLNRGNHAGAASLLGRALGKLGAYPAEFAGVEVERLREEIRTWLDELEQGRVAAGEFPRIR